MKKVLFLILTSVMLIGCIQYKIRVQPVGTVTYYTAMKREHGRWVEHYNSPIYKEGAMQQIQIWKELEAQRKSNRRPQYIKIK